MELKDFLLMYNHYMDDTIGLIIIEDLDYKELFRFSFDETLEDIMNKGYYTFSDVCVHVFYIANGMLHISLGCRG